MSSQKKGTKKRKEKTNLITHSADLWGAPLSGFRTLSLTHRRLTVAVTGCPRCDYHKNNNKRKKKKNKKRKAKEVAAKIWSPTPELSAYHFAFSATSHKVRVLCECMRVPLCLCEFLCVSVWAHYQSALNGMQWQSSDAVASLSLSRCVFGACFMLSCCSAALLCSISATFGSVCVCVCVVCSCRMSPGDSLAVSPPPSPR